MVEYTIDDIRGPTVAREMAQLKEFVLAQFNGAIADAEAAAAAAATAAANAILANTVKKTGEASQSIAGDVAVTGALDAAGIGSGSTPIVCGNLTAYGSVSLDDTVLQGNLTGADASALINLSGVGSVLVPAPTSNSEAATKKYVDDALDAYAPMVRTTGNQNMSGIKTAIGRMINAGQIMTAYASASGKWFKVATMPKQAGAVSRSVLFMFDNAAYSTGWWGLILMSYGATSYLPSLKWVIKNPAWTSDIDSVAVGSNGQTWEIWLRSNAASHRSAITLVDMCSEVMNQEYFLTLIDPSSQTEVASPTSDSTVNYIS